MDEDVEAALTRSRTSRHQALDNYDFGEIIIAICCRKKVFHSISTNKLAFLLIEIKRKR